MVLRVTSTLFYPFLCRVYLAVNHDGTGREAGSAGGRNLFPAGNERLEGGVAAAGAGVAQWKLVLGHRKVLGERVH